MVATDMGISTSLVYKWCEIAAPEEDQSGARNPLDRVLTLYRNTGDIGIIKWLCFQAGGFFTENIESDQMVDRSVLKNIQCMIKEFSELLESTSKSLEGDNSISKEESLKIRKEWEDLKGIAESFVVACEKGKFR